MPSVVHVGPAAPALGAAQRHRFAEQEREEIGVSLFGGRQFSYATALYCVEWHREYGSDPDDSRGYECPSVTLCELLSESGTSLLNAAGHQQCRAIERQLEEHEAEHGQRVPYRFSFHYD